MNLENILKLTKQMFLASVSGNARSQQHYNATMAELRNSDVSQETMQQGLKVAQLGVNPDHAYQEALSELKGNPSVH